MKANELRDKSTDELEKELVALMKERFNLRMQRGVGEPPKTHLFRKVKVEIARIKTILQEKGSNA